MSAALNSDHVNYLVWRYLQERGYGKSAIQLSREWGTNTPQQLPFAEAVKPHTLISMLQDGLAYDYVAANLPQSGRTDNDSARANSKRYKFLDTSKKRRHSESPPTETQQSNGVGLAGPRKRQKVDSKISEANGDSASRSPTSHHERRKSSKAANLSVQTDQGPIDPTIEASAVTAPARTQRDGTEPVSAQDIEVDVPDEPPQPPPPPPAPPLPSTLDLGICVGTQTQHVETDRSAKVIVDLEEPRMDAMHVRWEDDGVGTITLYGSSTWQSLDISAIDKTMGALNGDPVAKLEPNQMKPNSDSYFISAIASSKPRGGTCQIATAIEEGSKDPCMTLQIHGGSDIHMDNLSNDQGPITLLKFNPASDLLLASRTNGLSHTLHVWGINSDKHDGASAKQGCSVKVTTKAPALVLGLEWLSDDTFACCGLGHFQIYRVTKSQDIPASRIGSPSRAEELKDSGTAKESKDIPAESAEDLNHDKAEAEENPLPSPADYAISLVNEIDTSQGWYAMAYDSILNQVACISEDEGVLGLVQLDTCELHSKVAHEDVVTSVQWQPRPRGVRTSASHVSDPQPKPADEIADKQIADAIMTEAPQEGQEAIAEVSNDPTELNDAASAGPKTATTTPKHAIPHLANSQPLHQEVLSTLRLLATSCIDGTIKLWNAPSGFGTMQCLRTFHMASRSLMPCISLDFRPDGEYLAASGDRCIRVWKIPDNIERGEARDFRLLEEDRRRLCVVEWDKVVEGDGNVGIAHQGGRVNEAETDGVEANAPVQPQPQQADEDEAAERDVDAMVVDSREDASTAAPAQPSNMREGENGASDVEMKEEGGDETARPIVREQDQQQSEGLQNDRSPDDERLASVEQEGGNNDQAVAARATPSQEVIEDDDARGGGDGDEDDSYHNLLWDPTGTYLAYSGSTKLTLIKPNNIPPMASGSPPFAGHQHSEATAATEDAADEPPATIAEPAEPAEPTTLTQEPQASDHQEATALPDQVANDQLPVDAAPADPVSTPLDKSEQADVEPFVANPAVAAPSTTNDAPAATLESAEPALTAQDPRAPDQQEVIPSSDVATLTSGEMAVDGGVVGVEGTGKMEQKSGREESGE